VRDGILVAAAEEDRFRRIKHWAGFPIRENITNNVTILIRHLADHWRRPLPQLIFVLLKLFFVSRNPLSISGADRLGKRPQSRAFDTSVFEVTAEAGYGFSR
jgi:hypothetical protein